MTKKIVFYDLGNSNFYLMDLIINKDGMLILNGQTFNLDELNRRILKKEIRTILPINSRFSIHGIGYKMLVDEETYLPINEVEFVKDISDQIKKITGEKTSSDNCLSAFRDFLINSDNESLRQKLEEAYNSVPAHNRTYVLGDMDSKDYPLKWAIDKSIPKVKQTLESYYYEYFGKFEN